MADFTIIPGLFKIKVNDGHASEVYEIVANSVDAALDEARTRWASRAQETELAVKSKAGKGR